MILGLEKIRKKQRMGENVQDQNSLPNIATLVSA